MKNMRRIAMKKNNKILVIGSGPITIGQGAEFDYSGTQACQVLKSKGYKVILMNPNPATIMTDKEVADVIYSEPLTLEFAEKVIQKELPNFLIAGMGGQTALNLSLELEGAGILENYGVELIGTNIEAIKKSEDRELFKKTMESINQPVLDSVSAHSIEEVMETVQIIGLPVVVRPAYTLGGTGGGIAETEEELMTIAKSGLQLSMTNQVLIEKSIKGWKEIEYEMIRDAKGNTIAVCNMENLDPIGVHTGDSIVVAPSQTLCDVEYQSLRKASIAIVDVLDIKGGCNVQLAVNPNSFEYYVIEVNPRVSRSSALASKATGYPIAKVATQIALGLSLDEIDNDITGKTKACFEPTLDYCVVKIPKWPFDKFTKANKLLGTTMMATGEVMGIGNNFESALLKAIRSLEIQCCGLSSKQAQGLTLQTLLDKIKKADDHQLFYISELIRREVGLPLIHKITKIDLFFLDKLYQIVQLEKLAKDKLLESLSPDAMKELKKKGFSDTYISQLLLKSSPTEVYNYRKEHSIIPVYKMVDTCGGEFHAESPYYYSTYDQEDEVVVNDVDKVIVIGSGPIRIGQGVEFDYCSVHGVLALKKMGIEAIMINNNPETVSTDFDVSDKLYFEPITGEDVLNIVEKEQPIGVILQFGGQSAIKLAKYLDEMGVTILGTTFDQIHQTEERGKFNETMKSCDLLQPDGKAVLTVKQGIEEANQLGYPLLVRPSYVIGGFGMATVENEEMLVQYLEKAFEADLINPVLIDKYIMGMEVEVDAVFDGKDILIPGIMEHLDASGIHSGDSISVYPPHTLSETLKEKIVLDTKKAAKALNLKGVLNIQFVVANEEVYIIEVNPRSSRTVPFISKVTNIPLIEIATRVLLGAKLSDLPYGINLVKEKDFYAIKHPVFSMEKIKEVEIALGPEMKSTGEVMSVDSVFNIALLKAMTATYGHISSGGKAIVSLNKQYKEEGCHYIEALAEAGYEVLLTPGTYDCMKKIKSNTHNYKCISAEDMLKELQENDVKLIVNMPNKGNDKNRYGFQMRRIAVEKKIHCITSFNVFKAFSKMMTDKINLDDVGVCDVTTISNGMNSMG